MTRFLKIVAWMVAVPIVWASCSLYIQRYHYNPTGNPETKWQLARIPSSGFIFIGPSVFHQRIDDVALEEALGTEVGLVTSIGQSTLETLVLADEVAARTPEAHLLIAGGDRPMMGKGFHQCWHCSNLPASVIASEWSEVRDCFFFDAFVGLFAAFTPEKKPLTFAKTLEDVLSSEGWEQSYAEYLLHQDSIMGQMQSRLATQRPLPRSALYEDLCTSRNVLVLLPPNGRFESCPADFQCDCVQLADSSWIQSDLWIDASHLSPKGAARFTDRLQAFLSSSPVRDESDGSR